MQPIAPHALRAGSAPPAPAHAPGNVTEFVAEHQRYRSSEPRNAMSVDVEDYFQVAAFEREIDRAGWDARECRVEANIDKTLQMFSAANVRATFFALGWIAQRYPALIRGIVAAGHELASHGYDHYRVTQQGPAEFRSDVIRTKNLLEDLSGQRISGYRAPSYSIGRGTLWALDVLQEAGYRYSSSIYPVRHDLYGMPEAPRFAFRLRPQGLLELPVTTVRFAGRNWPCGGGGYFRLMPYPLYRWSLQRVNKVDGQPGIFYFHPWELDPAQPRIPSASLRSRFRHYLNLKRMRVRLERLLRDFRWGRIDEIFALS